MGTDGDPLGAGTKLPAGQTFVFGKNAGDYTGTADATYNFQVTEAGGFLIKDAGAVTQDAVGAPGTACAEGTGPDLPHDRRGLHLHPQGGRCRAAGHRRQRADFGGPSGAANGSACGAPCAAPPTPLAIDAVQGSGNTTPRNGQNVQITGVVVGVDNQQGVSNFVNLDPDRPGIYVETPTADQDANPATSEGIFVGGLGPADRAASHIGQTVTVSGKVTELFNLTAIDATGRTLGVSGGRPRQPPAPVTIDPAQAAAQSTRPTAPAVLRDARGDARAPRGRHRRFRRHEQVRRALPAARHHAPARVPHRVAAGRARRPAEPRPGRGLARRRPDQPVAQRPPRPRA